MFSFHLSMFKVYRCIYLLHICQFKMSSLYDLPISKSETWKFAFLLISVWNKVKDLFGCHSSEDDFYHILVSDVCDEWNEILCGTQQRPKSGDWHTPVIMVSDCRSFIFRLLMDNRIQRVPENTFHSLWRLAELWVITAGGVCVTLIHLITCNVGLALFENNTNTKSVWSLFCSYMYLFFHYLEICPATGSRSCQKTPSKPSQSHSLNCE